MSFERPSGLASLRNKVQDNPLIAIWCALAGLALLVGAVRSAWGSPHFLGSTLAWLIAEACHFALVGAIFLVPALVGTTTADRTGRTWAGWAAALVALCVMLALGRVLEGLPWVGWRLQTTWQSQGDDMSGDRSDLEQVFARSPVPYGPSVAEVVNPLPKRLR